MCVSHRPYLSQSLMRRYARAGKYATREPVMFYEDDTQLPWWFLMPTETYKSRGRIVNT